MARSWPRPLQPGSSSKEIDLAIVTVTGATGYIAGHVVEQLVDSGHSVRGTVRDVDAASAGFLGEAPLDLFRADLLDEGSFDEAVARSDAVIHVASPFFLTTDDPRHDLIDPAVNGTRNILGAAAKSPSVRRVVLTTIDRHQHAGAR